MKRNTKIKTEQIQIMKAVKLKQQQQINEFKINDNFEPHVILYYCDPLLYFQW